MKKISELIAGYPQTFFVVMLVFTMLFVCYVVVPLTEENLRKERLEKNEKEKSIVSLSEIAFADHVTFIPLGVKGNPRENINLIEKTISAFRVKYPKYANGTYQIEYADGQTNGIWIFY